MRYILTGNSRDKESEVKYLEVVQWMNMCCAKGLRVDVYYSPRQCMPKTTARPCWDSGEKKKLKKDVYWWERERERERDGDVREKHQLVASHSLPKQGLNPQPRYVPWLGIEPAAFWCTQWCSNQLSHTGQGQYYFFDYHHYKVFSEV